MRIMDNIRNGIKTWLRIQPAQRTLINISETLDFDGNAIKNRIWNRGSSEELSQFYKQIPGDNTRFWAAVPTSGMEIRKIHTGLPKEIVKILTSIVVEDMNEFKVTDSRQQEWKDIYKENTFDKLIKKAVSDTLVVGDGAFKVSFDNVLSQYPIVEFYPGDKVDIKYNRGRVCEIVFKTQYVNKSVEYMLYETYGYGYVNYDLVKDGRSVDMKLLKETENLVDAVWEDNFMMAVPFKVYESTKWEGRGESIFDGKEDAFDSLDESWSQWMDALRANRTREYIPENMLPRNPNTGEVLAPNSFDNRYIKNDSPMSEGAKNEISLQQGEIYHESYLSTYVTALDLCMQGLISPSTLGIDTKKLDNAEAQREKEKATLYTRNAVVGALQETISELINVVFAAYDTMYMRPIDDVEPDVTFGEYANPSFESQVETIGKARTSRVMSIEAGVEELYGDSKDEAWKKEEICRLKAEQGIVELEEPAVNMSAGTFGVDVIE